MASLCDLWMEALHGFYSLARGERVAELRDDRVRKFDSRGLHPLSLEAGRISALQDAEPVLREAGFDPVLTKRAAREDAGEAWLQEKAHAVQLLVTAAADRQEMGL